MEKIPLDCVYAVHPHPTNDRYFGILADHTPSGTVHCYCYTTKQPLSVRRLINGCMRILHEFELTAMHVRGVDNPRADALSRNKLPLFCSLHPQAITGRGGGGGVVL